MEKAATLAFSCQKSIPETLNQVTRVFVQGYQNEFSIRLHLISLIGFQKFILILVPGMILEDWDVELEWAYSFGIIS